MTSQESEVSVSPGQLRWGRREDFERALKEQNVEEVRRCLEIDSSLANEPVGYGEYPPLLYALELWEFWRHYRRQVLEVVRLLLEHQADVNAKGKGGLTALHYAVSYQWVELVELLLQYHADVNVRDNYGQTPLRCTEDVEMASLLIANGADVNFGCPVNVEMASLLIAHGADVNSRSKRQPFWFPAIRCGDTGGGDIETLKLLQKHGADLHATREFFGDSALHSALHFQVSVPGNLEVLEYLLDQGLDVNARTANGKTPLHYAVAKRGDYRQQVLPLLRLLLERGADVNATDHYGNTPFIRVFKRGDASDYIEIAELLIDHGADISRDGKEVLLYAVNQQPRNYSLVQWILEQGKVDLNARDSGDSADSDTLAFQILEKLANDNWWSFRRILMLLIQHGADVNAKHRQSGRTLLHFAVAMHRDYCAEFESEIQLLVEKGSDVNAVDKEGRTPFFLACEKGNLDYGYWNIARILVHHGADVNIVEEEDEDTPLTLACKRKDKRMVQLLLDAGAHVDYRLKDGATALLICVQNGFVKGATLLVERGGDITAADQDGCTAFLVACQKGKLGMIYRLIRSSPHHQRLGAGTAHSQVYELASAAPQVNMDGCDDENDVKSGCQERK